MAFQIRKATKQFVRLRAAFIGPAGSGKTFTALSIASGIGARVIVIDTERGSASKYADLFNFEVLELDTFAPDTYCDAIRACEEAGADVIVIDSLSHAWMGKDGALEMVDKAAARSNSRNSFDAWRSVTPQHNRFVDTMLRCKSHLLVTMRSKMEYVIEEDGRGKKVPRKVGLAPVQRDGLEYEFDVVGEMNADHQMVITKSRCAVLADQVFERPGAQVATVLRTWMTDAPSAPPLDTSARKVPDLAEFDNVTQPAEMRAAPKAEPAAQETREVAAPEPEALTAFRAEVLSLQTDVDAVALWIANRLALGDAGVAPVAKRVLAARVAQIRGNEFKDAGAWLAGAIQAEDQRRATPPTEPDPEPPTPPRGGRKNARNAPATGDATSAPVEGAAAPANSTGATSTFAPRAGASADEVLAAWRLHLDASANKWEAAHSWVKHEHDFAHEVHAKALRITHEAIRRHGDPAPASLLAAVRERRARTATTRHDAARPAARQTASALKEVA